MYEFSEVGSSNWEQEEQDIMKDLQTAIKMAKTRYITYPYVVICERKNDDD
jgi:hypothetical protein